MKNQTKKFYVISLYHSYLNEWYITIWRGGNNGYAFELRQEHLYSEEQIREGYHNNQDNIAIEKEKLEKLAIKVMGDDDEYLRVPNCKAVWQQLGAKPYKKGNCLTREEKYIKKS